MLNINELNNVRDKKQINKMKIYKLVLAKCHHRIKITAKQASSSCIYIIPEFLYGVPKYDIRPCAEYIIYKLTKNGLTVRYTHPNFLYIDWSNIPSQHIQKKENPINSKQTNNINQHRYIDDYRVSSNFMKKMNN